MRFSAGLAGFTGLLLAATLGAGTASAFGDLHRPHGRTLGCYKKQIERAEYGYVTREVMVRPAWVEVRSTRPVYVERAEKVLVEPARTVWVRTSPTYETVMKEVVVRPAGVRWVRKRRGLFDRDEVMCKVEVPAVVRTVPVRVPVDAGKRAKQHIPATYAVKHRRVLVSKGHTTKVKHPAVYRTVRERVLVSPGSVRWVKLRGC